MGMVLGDLESIFYEKLRARSKKHRTELLPILAYHYCNIDQDEDIS